MSSDPITQRLGEHLRRLRKQRGLSLSDVEVASEGVFKASVVGAYERGDRTISTVRLVALSELYQIPLRGMLPPDPDAPPEGASGVALDVSALEHAEDADIRTVTRYVRGVLAQRADWSGRVVRLRAEDARALAAVLDKTMTEFFGWLERSGVRAY